jgi:hypothetical protein
VRAVPSGEDLDGDAIELKALEIREWLGVGPLT